MPKASFRFLALLSALLAPVSLRAEPAAIALARAYLGPESTLESITSIHYMGTLERVDPDSSDKTPGHATLDLILAKPLRQRLVARSEKVTMTTVLDGYDAWDFLQDNAVLSRFRMTWLKASEIKNLRANTWENLYYYRAPEGGTVVDKGPATIDGVACERIDFTHSPGLVYERYFDRDTGRLVLTVRGPESFREIGEIRVDGIRFPNKIVSTAKTASGKDLVTTAIFDSIVLNEPVAASLFSAPSPTPQKPAPAGGK